MSWLMARDDGEWWLRGLPVVRSTSNPHSYDRALDSLQTLVAAAFFVTIVHHGGWLSAIAGLIAAAALGVAVIALLEAARGKGPLRTGPRPAVEWLRCVALPVAAAALVLAGALAFSGAIRMWLEIAGVALVVVPVAVTSAVHRRATSRSAASQ
jgi:small-conductance mechanosensitive channel